MKLEAVEKPFGEIEAGLHAIALGDGEELPAEYSQLPGAGEVRTAFRKQSLLRSDDGKRLLVLGLGEAAKAGAERLRVLAALAVKRARELEAGEIAWKLPVSEIGVAQAAAALAEGTILAAYRFDRFIAADPETPRIPLGSLTHRRRRGRGGRGQ